MNISTSVKGTELHIAFSGSFTFGDNPQFRTMLREAQELKPSLIIIDMAAVDFIDSAALGMLLLLRDTVTSTGTLLELHNPQGQIKKMFDLSKFAELFTIKD